MEISIPREPLLAALTAAFKVPPAKTPKEILRNVKATASKGMLHLFATDEEIGLTQQIPVESDAYGEFLLPLRILEICRNAKGMNISLDVNGKQLAVSSGFSTWDLSTTDPKEFPSPRTVEGKTWEVSKAALRSAIAACIFATDEASTRYALQGILLEPHQDGKLLTLVATDGRRLSFVKIPDATGDGEAPGCIIPKRAAALIDTLCDGEGGLLLTFAPGAIQISSEHQTLFSRLVEGRFPKYQDVVPREFPFSVPIPAGELLSAVNQAMIVTSEESRGVDFTFADGKLSLLSVGQDIGKSNIQIPVPTDHRDSVTLDPRYVKDWLRVIDPATSIDFKLIDDNKPVLLTSGERRYIVMPLANETKNSKGAA